MICAPIACTRASRQRARRAGVCIRRSGSLWGILLGARFRMHAQEGLHHPAPPSLAALFSYGTGGWSWPAPRGEIIPRARACDCGLLTGTKVAVVHFAV